MKHDVYKTGDRDAPEQIRDRNGAVVLLCCRACGLAEIELNETPECPVAVADERERREQDEALSAAEANLKAAGIPV